MNTLVDVSPNSSRDPKVNPIMKQQKDRIRARSLTRSTLGVGGCVGALDETRMNSQAKVQDDANLHN
jgi:hypothetical protein